MQLSYAVCRWDFICGVWSGALQTPALTQIQPGETTDAYGGRWLWVLQGCACSQCDTERKILFAKEWMRYLSGVQQWKAALKQLGSFYFLLWACLNRNVKLPYLEPQLGFSLISLLSTVISLFYFLFSCSKINVTWKRNFVFVRLAEKLFIL